jgi:exodeoxyribonuclease V alpha subunit
MVDSQLCWELCKQVQGMYKNVHFVFVGDIEQLPCIERASFVSAYISSGLPIITLTKNMRADNVILSNAHIVINKDVYPDFVSSPRNNITNLISNGSFEQIQGDMKSIMTWIGNNRDFMKDGLVLTPYNKVCDQLNTSVRNLINPGSDVLKFRPGDVVMQIKNYYSSDYELQYSENGRLTGHTGYRIVNGEVGTVTNVSQFDMTIDCKFGKHGAIRQYQIPKTKMDEFIDDDPFSVDESIGGELTTSYLRHSYCITIHKSQGSEANNGLVYIPYGYTPLLTRNLFYTAITRFKKRIVLYGDLRTVRRMMDSPSDLPLEYLSKYIRDGLY